MNNAVENCIMNYSLHKLAYKKITILNEFCDVFTYTKMGFRDTWNK